MKEDIERIAIVKLSAMGDIIHTMVVLQFIKYYYPNIIIDWFVEEAFSEVLGFNPDIDNVYKVNLKKIKKNKFEIFNQISLIRKYSKNNYDLVIDAQGLIKSSLVSRLLGKNVIGFNKESTRERFASFFYDKKVNIAYNKNIVDRNIKLIEEAFDINISKTDLFNKKPFLFFNDESNKINKYINKDKKNILLVIGASWKSKMYSTEKFIRIVNKLDENFLILWGSKEEETLANEIKLKSKAVIVEKLDLNELKNLISSVDIILGNDTGPSHMAWGMNIPSLILFGNTPGYRNTYETDINKYIQSDKKVNPLKLDRDDYSIKNIEETKIIKILKDMIND